MKKFGIVSGHVYWDQEKLFDGRNKRQKIYHDTVHILKGYTTNNVDESVDLGYSLI